MMEWHGRLCRSGELASKEFESVYYMFQQLFREQSRRRQLRSGLVLPTTLSLSLSLSIGTGHTAWGMRAMGGVG